MGVESMRALTRFARRGLRALGYEVVPFPPAESLAAHLLALFHQLGINCVFDIGAHVGEYGTFLREIGYRGHIISFEPVPLSFAVLEKQCSPDPKWRGQCLALGSRDGSLRINVTHATEFSSFLRPSRLSREEFAHRSDIVRVEEVEVRRLDSIFTECLQQIPDPHVYLKTDTQGYDLEVLEGAGARLADVLALQLELSLLPVYLNVTGGFETLSRLNAMGFEVTGLFPVSRSRDLRIIELDCVMRRTSPRAQGKGCLVACAQCG